MFTLLKKKNPYEQPARTIYAAVLDHIRQPIFYESGGVPDTLDGRFDLMLLHVFLVLNRLLNGTAEDEVLRQALFDVIFADMDQGLRESGIGDMGIPKHMRRMMKAFNGRMHAYKDAMKSGDWTAALTRNLYGTRPDVEPEILSSMTEYIHENIKTVQEQSMEDLRRGVLRFKKAEF